MKPSDSFKKDFDNFSLSMGISGSELSDARRNFNVNEESDEKKERNGSTDYLKKDVDLADIMKLVKNKKLSNNKIKNEIRKLLKDPEELYDFLRSLISKTKIETKEVSSSGGGVGAYEAPLFGDMKEKNNNIKKVETKEATSTSSSGAYEGPSIWAKTNSKKNWKPSRKTQIPGGKFVQVKKKCKRFPYCNQGDIKALNIFENNTVKRIINKVSERYNLHEEQ